MKCLLISLIVSYGCSSQPIVTADIKKDTTPPQSSSMYYIPTVNPNFEKFDFQKDKEKYVSTDLIYYQNDKGHKGKSYKFEEKNDNKVVIKDYGLLDNGKVIEPIETTYYDNSPFEVRKTFYPNGNIKEKGVCIVKGNFYKGTWHYFDEKGDLIQTIDNDKIYGFKWEDVEKYMIQNKIPIRLGNTYHGRNAISRFSPLLYPQSSVKDPALKSEKKQWSITWRGEVYNQYYDIVLDGDTGKLLYRKKYWIKEEPGHNVPDPIIEDFTK